MKRGMLNIALIMLFIISFSLANVVDIQAVPKQPKVKSARYMWYNFTFVFIDTDADGCYDYLVVFKDNGLIFDTPFVVINPIPNDTTFIQDDSRIENLTIEQCQEPSTRYFIYFDAFTPDSIYIGSLRSDCNSDTAFFVVAGSPIFLSNILEANKSESRTIILQKSKVEDYLIPFGDEISEPTIIVTNSIGKIVSNRHYSERKDGLYLHLKELACGIYFVRITSPRIILFYKIIIY